MTEFRDPWGNAGGPAGSGGNRPWRAPPEFEPPVPAPAPTPGKNPYKRLLRQIANALCAGLSLVFLFGISFGFVLEVISLLFPGVLPAIWRLSPVGIRIFEMAFSTAALLVPALLIAHFLNMPLRAAFPMRRAPAKITVSTVFCCLGTSIFGVYSAALIGALISAASGATPTMPDFTPPPFGVGETIVFLISMSVVPAIFEELLCRGVVMQALRRFGDSFALVASSLLFAMLHRNFVQGPNAFLVGLVLGYFTLRSGSLIPAIVAHFVVNFMSVLLTIIMMNMPLRYAQMLSFSVVPTYLALGAVGIIMMFLWCGGFTPLRHAPTGLAEWKKYALFFTAPLALVFIALTLGLTSRFFA